MKQTTAHYRERLAQLRSEIDAVEPGVAAASGFAGQSARIDFEIAKFFEEYVTWELDHPEDITEALVHNETFPGYLSGKPIENADEIMARKAEPRFHAHLDRELSGAMDLLARAKATLAEKFDWPEVPDVDWTAVTFVNGYFRSGGRPVFTAGFNYFGQSKRDTDDFMQTMRSLGVGFVSCSVAIPTMLKADGTVDEECIHAAVDAIRERARKGFKINMGFGWPKHAEVLEPLWPGITEHDGNFFGLEIDHPGMKEMIQRVMPVLMPALADVDAIVSWDMANEPFFMVEDWGPHALANYKTWLATRYADIDALNDAWQSGYAGFDAIAHPKETPQGDCSAGEWHDRLTFNNVRVASFFELVSSEVRRHRPDILIHLKGQDNSSLGPMPNCPADGIDREMLSRSTRLQGLDTRPLPVTEPRMAAQSDDPVMAYDGTPYGLHWLGQSFLYDYLTDLQPRQPIVDFEYHAFSINAIRVPDIDPGHARVTLWLAHLHGLIGNWAWYWHQRSARDPFREHYLKLWFYGSISTQPLLAAGYFQTMLELNAHAEAVEALVTQPERPVRLLVSKPSYNQNGAHIAALHRAYEGLCFHGFRVGFTTEQMLIDAGVPDDCRKIMLPDAAYIDERALDVLTEAQGNGVELSILGQQRPTYTPHGRPHKEELLSFLADVPVFDYGPAQSMSEVFRGLVSDLADVLDLQVTVAGSDAAFGVMQRQACLNGRRLLLLINVTASPLDVHIRSREGQPVSGFDALARETIDGAAVHLPFLGVRLITVGA